VEVVERMLRDSEDLKSIAEHFSQRDEGMLSIATTHTQAQYALPRVVVEFRRQFPNVHLTLHESAPDQIVEMLLDGRADIGVATEGVGDREELTAFPFYTWRHVVIVPPGHDLEHEPELSLATLSAYPLITYREGFTGRDRIDRAFKDADLDPTIVLAAMDADVIRKYVALGLGIGIIASMAVEDVVVSDVRVVGPDDLFEQNTTRIAIRRGRFLRGFAYRFMELCDPRLSEETVRRDAFSGSSMGGQLN
jgi:LysR family transcriptional regulator, cys regulon transcriptional activator